ncbi:hypothetical protein [Micromonospora sp. RTGN7]|uniref:hypothetical protein n=1 Tax=Micromonospora sp. RTGN7 TaxID=3016526 RepID=UPI0029FEC89B|nr:hypothetical protein [Micromonospora sp. RTGN7]
MTTPSGDRPEDDYWRRPPNAPSGDGSSDGDGSGGAGSGPVSPGAASTGVGPVAGYGGPPPTTPPPPGWRPPVHLRVAPPRQLPRQDMSGLDAEEQRGQWVTWGVGGSAALVLVALLCLLCSRALF